MPSPPTLHRQNWHLVPTYTIPHCPSSQTGGFFMVTHWLFKLRGKGQECLLQNQSKLRADSPRCSPGVLRGRREARFILHRIKWAVLLTPDPGLSRPRQRPLSPPPDSMTSPLLTARHWLTLAKSSPFHNKVRNNFLSPRVNIGSSYNRLNSG